MDRWTADLSLSHAPVKQQKGSPDLSEQEAPTHLLGHMRTGEDWASPTCTLCLRERCLWLSDHTNHLHHLPLSLSLSLSAVCQHSSSSSSNRTRRGREACCSQYQTSSPLVGTATLAVKGTRPFPLSVLGTIRQDWTRLPRATRGRTGLGSAGPTPGISCLCAGSPTTALPLVRRFPPQHRTTAPVRQAQDAKPQCPVG